MTVTCPDDGVTVVPVTIYVDEVKVSKPKNHKTDIVLDDKMNFAWSIHRDQFVESFSTGDKSEEVVNKTFKVIADCMDTIYTEEDGWDVNDYSPSERLDFVEKLSSKQYKEVEKFCNNALSHTFEVINPNTKQRIVSFWRVWRFFG